jgi:hypothetical protein
MKKLTVWVTGEEEKYLRHALKDFRNDQGETGCRP